MRNFIFICSILEQNAPPDNCPRMVAARTAPVHSTWYCNGQDLGIVHSGLSGNLFKCASVVRHYNLVPVERSYWEANHIGLTSYRVLRMFGGTSFLGEWLIGGIVWTRKQ